MRRTALALPLGIAVLVLAATVDGAPNKPGALLASVASSGTATLTDEAGQLVRRVRAGRYTITVRDRSARGNFHLRSLSRGRLDKRSSLRFVGTVRWTLTLARGSYEYFSDNRPAQKRRFTVS